MILGAVIFVLGFIVFAIGAFALDEPSFVVAIIGQLLVLAGGIYFGVKLIMFLIDYAAAAGL